MAELKHCPICGHNAKRVTEKHMGLSQYQDHGVICSNAQCSWHLGWTVYPDTESAEKAWNKRVDRQLYLLEKSKELSPCRCGGQPEILGEAMHQRDMLWCVFCPSCKLLLTGGRDIPQLIDEWNIRYGKKNDDTGEQSS